MTRIGRKSMSSINVVEAKSQVAIVKTGKGAREEKELLRLRQFGVLMAFVLELFAAFFFWRGKAAGPYLALIGAAFALAALLAPKSLRHIERIWLAFGEKMSVLMSYVILGILYYLLMVPLGVLLRLFGKDLLQLKFEREKKSYWVPVEIDGPSTRYFLPY